MDLTVTKEKLELARKVYEGSYVAKIGSVSSLGLSDKEVESIAMDTAKALFVSDLSAELSDLYNSKPSYEDEFEFDQWCSYVGELECLHEAAFDEAVRSGSIAIPSFNESTTIGVKVNYKGEEDGEMLLMDEAKKIMSVFIGRYNYI